MVKTKVIFDVHTLRTCYDNWFKHTYEQLWSNNCEPLDALQFLLPFKRKKKVYKMPQQEVHTFEHDCIHI